MLMSLEISWQNSGTRSCKSLGGGNNHRERQVFAEARNRSRDIGNIYIEEMGLNLKESGVRSDLKKDFFEYFEGGTVIPPFLDFGHGEIQRSGDGFSSRG